MPMERCATCGNELLFDPIADILICPVCEPSPAERLEQERELEAKALLAEGL